MRARYASVMPEIGIAGLVVILIVALLVFGPKRLPEIGRSLGKGMREFKDSITGDDKPQPQPELQPRATDEAPPPPSTS
jgi:sec-independent protein translocase protein TatA